MAAFSNVSPADFLDSLISLVGAFVLGALIGAERQYRQRSGGLRTNALVAVGAATFVDIGMHLNGNAGATQVIAYVVSGVGFLGAGVIMKEGKNVWGLNTAATLWCSAAVGCCAGADLAVEAVVLTILVLAGNTLLRPLVNAINRAPISEQSMEATYEVRATTDAGHLEAARELMETQLETANYPVRELVVIDREPDSVELVATLVANAADPAELDRAAARLGEAPFIEHASWTVRNPE
jgi:putative Mg2+ transporter-C (MgtC) family protein